MNGYLGYFLMLQPDPLKLYFLFIIHLKVCKLKKKKKCISYLTTKTLKQNTCSQIHK